MIPLIVFIFNFQVPGQFAQLSHAVADFGCLSLRSVSRRVVMVKNFKDRTLVFQWEVYSYIRYLYRVTTSPT